MSSNFTNVITFVDNTRNGPIKNTTADSTIGGGTLQVGNGSTASHNVVVHDLHVGQL